MIHRDVGSNIKNTQLEKRQMSVGDEEISKREDLESDGEEANSGLVGLIGRLLGPLLFVAVLLSPAPEGLTPTGQRLLAVTLLMATWWVTQAIPIAATSLLPLTLFPLLGIQSAKTVSQSYLGDSSFLYLGGFIIALGIERWGLHRRIALMTVNATGTSPKRIVLGFMLATFALSMWMSNTGTTLLMLPIGLALLTSLERLAPGNSSLKQDPHFAHLGTALPLGIAYSATIGGMATIVGTPTNLVFIDIWSKSYPEQPVISASQWMLTWTPFGLVFLFCAWQVLVWGLGTPSIFNRFHKTYFRDQLRELGPMSIAEKMMLLLFVATATLWLFRTDFTFGDWTLVRGWSGPVGEWLVSMGVPKERTTEFISDGTVAMAIASLMYMIPVTKGNRGQTVFLMDWETTSRIPWGILLLFGGGFAIAGAFETTKLSIWFGTVFKSFAADQPTWLLVTCVCTMLTFLTEFTSNVATANTVLPIIAAASDGLGIDPRLLMIPATICASCGFMLPIGTPPNSIVYGTGRIKMGQMVRYGILLNLTGIALAVTTVYFLMIPQLGIVVAW